MSQDPDDDFQEPPHLRRLRWLVTGLTVALIVGVLAIAATIVIRLGVLGGREVVEVTAPSFDLPKGQEVVAVGRGDGTVMFVLRDAQGAEALHVFDARTGEPLSTTPISRTDGED